MTDITKCQGRNCDKKFKCYRYTAPFGWRQSMANFDDDPENCKDFWDISGESEEANEGD